MLTKMKTRRYAALAVKGLKEMSPPFKRAKPLLKKHKHRDNAHLTFKTLKYFCINYGEQKVFKLWNRHKCLG